MKLHQNFIYHIIPVEKKTRQYLTVEYITLWTYSNLSPGQSYKMVVRGSSDYYCSIHYHEGKLLIEH